MRLPTTVLLLVLLSLWAVLGDTLTVPLLFGFDLLFSSIPAFLAMFWLGPSAGLLVAALGGGATWLFWGHPYAMVVFIAEIALVSGLRSRAECRGRRPLAFAAADAFFWLALGIPLTLFFYHFALGLPWFPAWLIALKLALNGIINAALAGLIVLAVAWFRNQRRAITFDRILFNILVLALLLPALALSLWQSQELWQSQAFARALQIGATELMDPIASQTAPLLKDSQQGLLKIFFALLALALFAIAIASWLSAWLMRPLHQLIESTQQLPVLIASSRPLSRLSQTLIRETDELAETILGMARSLRTSFRQLEQEKQHQARQQALSALQASLLSKLIDEEADEASFAELLCDQVEMVLPGYRCLLLRQTTTGELVLLGPLRRPLAGIDMTRLAFDPLLIAHCQEALQAGAACPLKATHIASAASLEPSSREAAGVSGWVLPIVGYSTVMVAIEQQQDAREPIVTFVSEVLVVATRLAGVAFEALQLRRRHQVLIDALSQAETGVIITERTQNDDLISYVNSGFEAMTGYRAAEVIGRNCRFLQGPERAQPARWQMRAALREGAASNVIVRNYRKDGSYFWNSLHLSPMRDHQGQVSHYIAVQQDLTEEIEMLERLRESEAQLKEAQAIAHVGSWELDLYSGQAQWSEETFRLFGFEPGAVEASHTAYLAIVADEDRERVRKTIATLDEQSTEAIQIEHNVLGPDGVARTLLQQGRIQCDAEGKAVRLVGTCLDVTELRRSEAMRLQQEERYRLMVDNVEDLIVRIDLEGRFEFVSPSYCQTFGHSEDELLGERLLPPEPGREHSAATATIELLLKPPYTNDIEQCAYTCKGWRWLQWSSTAMRDARGEVTGVIGVGRDMTERKQAQTALAEREAMVSELLALATDFVSVSDASSDTGTEQALARVGGFIGADRCYLFCLSADGRKLDKILERTAEGVAAIGAHYRGRAATELPMMLAQLAVGEPVVIADVAEFGTSRWIRERHRLEAQPVCALLLVPLQLEGRLFGFVGAEMVSAPRQWSTVETLFLQLFANILVASEQRTRSLQALRQSNARYDSLARESRTVTWELDAEGRFAYISDVCEVVLGYPSAAMLGQHYSDYLAEPEAAEAAVQVAERMERQQPFEDVVLPFRSEAGELLWLASDGTPVLNEDGQLQGYRGVTRDVSERQRALQRLARSEARLSAIFDHAPLGIALVGPDRRPVLANQALAQFLGAQAKVLNQMRLDEFTHPNDLRQTIDALHDLFAGRCLAHRFTSRYLRADGELIWGDLRLSLLSASPESEPLVLAMLEDVTEINDARSRQRAAEQELADYAEQLEYMIDVVNLSQPYSDQIESLLRLARRTLRIDTAEVWLMGDAGADCLLKKVPEAGDPQLQGLPPALVAKASDELGSPVLLSGEEVGAAPKRDQQEAVKIGLMLDSLTPDGQAERLFLALHGETEIPELDLGQSQLLRMIAQRVAAVRYREHLQEDLVQSRERETIGHLASGVSHDFNNLLGVIDANLFFIASALQEQGAADPELGQVIADTISALGQAKVLTSGMLTMSGSGRIPLEPLDVAHSIRELALIIEQVLPARIRLELELEDGLQAFSNRAFLQSALLNLSLNARDAILGEGTLTIGARLRRWEGTSDLAIGELPAMDCVEIRVCDTGVGMSAELISKIFRPLFTTKTKSRGHGFGLFMVREFVFRTQAGLSLESEPGAGSCFRLLLPTEAPNESAAAPELAEEQAALLAEAAQQRARDLKSVEQLKPAVQEAVDLAQAEQRAGQPAQTPLHLLLVEDDRRVRDAISRVLRAEGIEVETAEQGQAALALLANSTRSFDLVLSDIAMPVMDGLELHKQLLERHPELPVILMTGQQAHWDPPRNQHDEPTLILRKPIDLEVLRQAIQDRV
ncbi:MAG: PAS domain S-box protein [Lamprobacter sp.]|uniref:PAS domain S-box protein n=1 Tax=Lamprobacter sp. TaxID=3100796 RepID=UPI002B258B20|nr:PAS domain S-box protein [Lamprobacter sp.]MEA3639095.1 PAS domain S-box protein [Lamprobacter sp.]